MAVVAAPPCGLRRVSIQRIGGPRQCLRKFIRSEMQDESTESCKNGNKTAICGGLHLEAGVPQREIAPSPSNLPPRVTQHQFSCSLSDPSNLRFDRLQPLDDECDSKHKRAFGRFVAREALLDEEYWTAAWLRAESYWEEKANVRHVERFKRKFAEQEFNALKRRCSRQHADKCICIVTVKKDDKNVKRTVLNSIVGTLDISIRHHLSGEIFPGEHVKVPAFCSIAKSDQPRYGYVANLCVAKYARRQGIASNMLLLAVEVAKLYGLGQIFVHVDDDNIAAQKLYDRTGFQIVEMAIPCLSAQKQHLLSFKT